MAPTSRYTSKTALMHLHSQCLPSAPEVKTLFGAISCNGWAFRRRAKKRKTGLGVKVQNQRIKWQAVVIAASGIVSLGALAAAIGQEQTVTAKSGNMSVGETTTSTTPPVVPATVVARPIMKAERPRGF